MSVLERYADKISGINYCYDRINIKCTASKFGFPATNLQTKGDSITLNVTAE